MEKDKNYALISDFIVLAKADDKIVASEYDFILRMASRMDVTKEEVDKLMEDPLPSLPLVTELERIAHFHKLISLMNVDWEAHEKEIAVLRNFGLKMGIRPAAIDRILLRSQQHEDKVIPSEELIQIFQTYYN